MSHMLHVGSKGPEVSLVQKELKKCVDTSLVVDGKFGPHTQAAVIKFQKAAGFKGRDVDGIVGPKTTVALFRMFNVSVCGNLTPKSAQPNNPTPPGKPPAPKPPAPPPPAKVQPKTNPTSSTTDPPDELPRWFQLSGQPGFQYSARDGAGLQLQLGFTYRSRDYFPRSPAGAFYHGMHNELMLATVLGIPLPPSSTYTGQLVLQAQPITDWLVLWDRLHLLTPSIGIYGQIPLYTAGSGMPMTPMVDDPATHSRAGAFLGLEFFHVDIIKDYLSFGASGQLSGYWDFRDDRVFFDPSILGFFQGTFGAGPRYRPLPSRP